MSIPDWSPLPSVRQWLADAGDELRELGRDAADLVRSYVQRLRRDPHLREALLQGVLRGFLNALTRGPRATLLWAVVLVLEVILEAMRALSHDRPDEDDPFAYA